MRGNLVKKISLRIDEKDYQFLEEIRKQNFQDNLGTVIRMLIAQERERQKKINL